MAEDKAQSQAPWQPPEPGLEGRMLGLALVWGLLDPADLREAHAEAATDDSAGLLVWLAGRGLLTPDQLEEMEAEARHVAMAADAAPTARYRIPDTESVLLPDAGGPPSGAFRLPDAFRAPVFRPDRSFHVVFDRSVYQRVRDEDLGRVRGQPIRPVLAGFGEPGTDWLF